jgi:hypothetical protein
MRHLLLLVLPLAAALSACTSLEPAIATAPSENYDLVDRSKVDMAAYERDYTECAEIANQNHGGVTNKVTDLARASASKVSFGVIGSSKSAEADRGSVLRKCLAGRGYHLLR